MEDWLEESWAVINQVAKILQKTICRLPWAALVYPVWIDRDLRVHHVKIRTEVEILKAITFGIRSRLLACIRFNNSVINDTLC